MPEEAPSPVDLWWPTTVDEQLLAAMHRIAAATAALGGAVGWLSEPGRAETDPWVTALVEEVAAGDAGLCLAVVDGVAQATGSWRRERAAVMRRRAEVTKVMAHPDGRGLGLGRIVVGALVADARRSDVEVLHLGVRGNNHLAIAIYEAEGFREWGRLPDSIAVGDLRFDEVRMYQRLSTPPGVRPLGSAPGGPGGSPAPPAG